MTRSVETNPVDAGDAKLPYKAENSLHMEDVEDGIVSPRTTLSKKEQRKTMLVSAFEALFT